MSQKLYKALKKKRGLILFSIVFACIVYFQENYPEKQDAFSAEAVIDEPFYSYLSKHYPGTNREYSEDALQTVVLISKLENRLNDIDWYYPGHDLCCIWVPGDENLTYLENYSPFYKEVAGYLRTWRGKEVLWKDHWGTELLIEADSSIIRSAGRDKRFSRLKSGEKLGDDIVVPIRADLRFQGVLLSPDRKMLTLHFSKVVTTFQFDIQRAFVSTFDKSKAPIRVNKVYGAAKHPSYMGQDEEHFSEMYMEFDKPIPEDENLGLHVHLLWLDFTDGSAKISIGNWIPFSSQTLPKEFYLREPDLSD